jgi:hypothetical protein
MDWTTLCAAFLGGGCGGAIPAVVSIMQFRRDTAQNLQARRWVDAEIVADATALLMDLDPQRRTINANVDSSVEANLWKDPSQRKDQLYKQLLLLAAGHPSQDVAASADELGLELLWLAQRSQFAVSALRANRNFHKILVSAQERHKAAETALGKLTIATKDAATPKRRLFKISAQKELEDPPPQKAVREA